VHGVFLEKTSILHTCCASPAAPVGDFCAEGLAAPVGDFCTGSLLEKTSILRTYCAGPAAPVGNFCAESFGEDLDLRTYCAGPAAPVGDFLHGGSGCTLRRLLHGESIGEDFDFAHLLCWSGCTRRRLLARRVRLHP
jgi:hypothetical protein